MISDTIWKVPRFFFRRIRYYNTKLGFFLAERPRLQKIAGSHQGKRCFIIGNGPSIAQQDLTRLQREYCFVTNWFILHQDFELIKPRFYCVSDPRFFSHDFINSTWYQMMVKKTQDTIKFFPLEAKKVIKNNHLFKEHTIYYLDYSAGKSWLQSRTNLDITKPLFSGDTIIIDFCLPVAHYLGFNEIYLIGCDSNLGLLGNDKSHFYNDTDHNTEKPANGYHSDYWLENVNKSYSIINKEFQKTQVRIFNAGVGGNLEVFERVDYDSLFK